MKPSSRVDHIIDLSLPPHRRWEHVAKAEKPRLKKLVGTIKAYVLSVPRSVFRMASGFFWMHNAKYLREANAFADILDEPRGLIQAAQVMYELVHLVDKRAFAKPPPSVGCTTVGMIYPTRPSELIRTLDWDLPGMKDATRIFRFRGKHGDFLGVGTLGSVSILTGLHITGKYALAMNDAPAVHGIRLGRAPSFQIRRAMENYDDAASALDFLSETKMATSAFFMGVTPFAATVIEHTGRRCEYARDVAYNLAITNHYRMVQPYAAEDVPGEDKSRARLAKAQLQMTFATPRKINNLFNDKSINLPITQYRARAQPDSGKLEVF